MELKYLKAENYRNIISADISFKDGVNLLYGHNGAGKTTLVKLIMGLYNPTEGTIKISDKKTSEYEPKSLHRRFGTVFQDLQVFALPLSHNVLMRKPKSDDERKLVGNLCGASS